MRARQRKSARAVIERRVLPTRGVMAGLAGGREIPRAVVRVRRIRIILQMAAGTRRRSRREIVARVALGALHGRMQSRQRKRGQLVVVESCARPRQRRVAQRAILRESCRDVVRILGRGEIVSVAPEAHRRRTREAVPHMALRAGQRRMSAGQGKTRELAVVEPRRLPNGYRVAAVASGGQPGRDVVQRSCGLKILEVARHTLRAQPDVRTGGGAEVAGVARRRGVRAQQREPVVVVANGGNLNIPPAHAVALLAILSELPPMQIRVTLRAPRRRLREN